ncbi:MAG: DUF3301 domain-containing protein [Betaproteobacteria bacterium]|nr:DUF3301 domain-containing protein [Betaproteobacteria bacterium]
MSIFEILGLTLLGAGAWLWLDSLKTREIAVSTGRSVCAAEGLQFLDESVAIESLWPARDGEGSLKLRRVYSFEYSDTGNNRCKGSVTLIGQQVVTFYVGPRLV